MEREEKPLKEWIEAAQLTLCRSRVVIGQPTKVKGEGLNKNFMVYPVVLETVRPQAPLSPASAAKVERNSEADDDDDDTVDRQVAKRRFSEFELTDNSCKAAENKLEELEVTPCFIWSYT